MTMETATPSTFKKMRDALQQGIYCVINPFVRMLIRIGVTPNMVTTIGLLGNIAAAAVFVWAGYTGSPVNLNYPLVTLAGTLIILFSLFDMLDGQVARLGNMASTFGAMYDSVLDRYCELFTLGGISFYFIQTGHVGAALITFVALVGSIMVSYWTRVQDRIHAAPRARGGHRPRRHRHRTRGSERLARRVRRPVDTHCSYGHHRHLRQHHRLCPYRPCKEPA